MKEINYSKVTDFNDVIAFLTSKGFKEVDYHVAPDSASKMGAYSYTRLTHSLFEKMKVKLPNTKFTPKPELIMYFDSLDESGYVFSLSWDLGLNETSYVPFFGSYSRVVRKNKSFIRVNNSLNDLFSEFHKFVEYSHFLSKKTLSDYQKRNLVKSLIECRFLKNYITAGITVDLNDVQYNDFLTYEHSFAQKPTYFNIFAMIHMALFNDEYFTEARYKKKDKKGSISEIKLAKPIKNVFRSYELRRLLYNVLDEKVFGKKEEDDDPTEVVEFDPENYI